MKPLVDLPHSDPVPRADPEYLMKDGLILVLIDQIPNQIPSFPFLLYLEVLDAAIMPPCYTFLPLQCDDEHIDIVISPEDVFVRIDEIIRQ